MNHEVTELPPEACNLDKVIYIEKNQLCCFIVILVKETVATFSNYQQSCGNSHAHNDDRDRELKQAVTIKFEGLYNYSK